MKAIIQSRNGFVNPARFSLGKQHYMAGVIEDGGDYVVIRSELGPIIIPRSEVILALLLPDDADLSQLDSEIYWVP